MNIGTEKSWQKILLKNFTGEKEKKWTYKEKDKHEDADSLLHYTTRNSQCLCKISKS